MHVSSLPRRTCGILAAATIGLSVVFVGVPGLASAEPAGVEESDTSSVPDGEVPGSQVPEADVAAAGQVVLAASPAAPVQNAPTVLNGALELDFVDQGGAVPATGYEARINSSPTPAALTTSVRDGRTIATVGGLLNGQIYTIEVRAVGGTGTTPSGWSNLQSAAPRDSADAATGVTAAVGPSSILVSWSAPANTAGIVGYTAFASPVGIRHSGRTVVCDVPTATRSCLLPVEAGVAYDVAVISNESGAGFFVEQRSATATTALVPAPSAPSRAPAGVGTLSGPSGPLSTVAAGGPTTVLGTGFAPFTTVALVAYPGPVALGTVGTDQDGAFTLDVALPTTMTNGPASVVAIGILADGRLRTLRADVTLSGGVAVLATTGFDAVPVALGGGLFLLAGAGLVVGARRRSTNA